MQAATLTLTRSTIGLKVVMAVTGVVLVGFVIAHMLGNLQVYLGPETLNAYGEFLHSKPGLLWGARTVLLVSVFGHIVSAYRLASRNSDARPVGYAKRRYVATNYAARTMVWSGPILLLFIVYHLLHLTVGYSAGDYVHDPANVYGNVVGSFQNPFVSLFYIVAMLALGKHLFHGVWSLFQSLGLSHPRYDAKRRTLATAVALAVVIGNISIPVSVLLGIVQ
jgi:succinate dehydrogenase / fumarate reductase cytochrome b subunit